MGENKGKNEFLLFSFSHILSNCFRREKKKGIKRIIVFHLKAKEGKMILLSSLSDALQKECRIVHQKINAAVQRVLIQRDRSSTFDPFFLRRKLLGNKSLSLRPHYVHPSTWQSFLPDLRPTSDRAPVFSPVFVLAPKTGIGVADGKIFSLMSRCSSTSFLPFFLSLLYSPFFLSLSLSLCIVISFVKNSSIFF